MAARVLCRDLIAGPPIPADLSARKAAEGSPRLRGAAPTPTAPTAPPTVKRGEHAEQPETVELVLSDGSIKIVTRRTGNNGKVGFIDWLNITFHEMTAHALEWGTQITDAGIVMAISAKLEEVLGFGITAKCEKGRNFYQTAYTLGDDCGYLCHGGQRGTVLLMLNGTGLAAALDGWEQRLYDFLTNQAVTPRITRCDVAHDCFDGEYTVDQALADYDSGAYRLLKSPINPDCEQRGNWRRINGKGRSFYVGHRTSGKFLRVYEKGMQLGSPTSKWVRVECEYKSADRVIPFDILLNPGSYLAGAYPALEWIDKEQSRIVTTRNTLECEKERKERWIKDVCGKDLAVLLLLEPGATLAEQALNMVRRLMNESKFPKWATLPEFRRGKAFIHSDIYCAPDDGTGGDAACIADFERMI